MQFLKDSYYEFKTKIDWAKWSDLQETVVVVGISTIILSLFLFVVDFSFRNILEVIYSFLADLFN